MLPVMQNDFLGPSPNCFCLQPVITPLSFSELLLFVFNSCWLLWLWCQQVFNTGPEIASTQFSLGMWHPCHLLQLLRHQSTSSVLTFGQVFKSLFPWIFLFSSTFLLSSYCWLGLCWKPILFIYLFSPGKVSSNVNESSGVPLPWYWQAVLDDALWLSQFSSVRTLFTYCDELGVIISLLFIALRVNFIAGLAPTHYGCESLASLVCSLSCLAVASLDWSVACLDCSRPVTKEIILTFLSMLGPHLAPETVAVVVQCCKVGISSYLFYLCHVSFVCLWKLLTWRIELPNAWQFCIHLWEEAPILALYY